MSQDKHTFDGMIYAQVTLQGEVSHTEVSHRCRSMFLDMPVLSYELSAVPLALFNKYGDMRSPSKAMLKNKLQVEVSDRCTCTPDAIIIDGCALLWSVHWLVSSTVHQYIKNFVQKLHEYLNHCCVSLIFDRYPASSTKSAT